MKRILIFTLFTIILNAVQAQIKFHLGSPTSLRAAESTVQEAQETFGPMFVRNGKALLNEVDNLPQILQAAEVLSVQLFEDTYAEAEKKELRITESGAIYWIGDLTGDREGVFELLWSGGYLTGSINDYSTGKVYDITAKSTGAIRVTELDAGKNPQPNEDCFYHHDEESEDTESEAQSNSEDVRFRADVVTETDSAIIDVLIVYPTHIALQMGDSEPERRAKIEAVIEQANQIFKNSEVYVRFRLAGHEINNNIPSAATSQSDVFGGIGGMRTKYGADIVSHWNYNGTSGSGAMGAPGSSSSSGFNTANYAYVLSQYTFAHECGHNLGVRHDRYDYYKEAAGTSDRAKLMEKPGYQFGKCFLEYRTVMAYANSKQLPGYVTSKDKGRILHYANPDVLYNDVPTGVSGETPVDTGDGGPANAARRINETAKTAENWLSPVSPTYYTLTINNGVGGGQYTTNAEAIITASAPPPGQVFDKWTGDDVNRILNVNETTTTFYMGTKDAAITATYKVVSTNIYRLTVNYGSGSGDYETGAVIPIVGNRPTSGQVFDKWTGDVDGISNVNERSTNFTMGTANAEITATYTIPSVIESVEDNYIKIYEEFSDLVVESSAPIQSVSVYNTVGAVIRTVSSNANTVQIPCVGKGIFIVKVILHNGKIEARKVISRVKRF
ncbi:MAG: M12 family metallo-peptidase [Prevotellaceae bacterium]|nr:M12 family metallo-peptidase [Prevotellaceae bacterium]